MQCPYRATASTRAARKSFRQSVRHRPRLELTCGSAVLQGRIHTGRRSSPWAATTVYCGIPQSLLRDPTARDGIAGLIRTRQRNCCTYGRVPMSSKPSAFVASRAVRGLTSARRFFLMIVVGLLLQPRTAGFERRQCLWRVDSAYPGACQAATSNHSLLARGSF